MKVRTEFSRKVREIENVWIPTTDGCRLAARVWLPEDAEERPVPAILEYIPYRKRDGTRARDNETHAYFAGHGYASVRVDLRGCGDSDGIILDEYLPQEQDDAVDVIRWLADQPWCTGAVGMIGISWGGFNGLQVAARQPPELKAVITLCSTDDRYADDVHYMGGCLLNDNHAYWGAAFFSFTARPPDPEIVGDRWRDMWFERLGKLEPYAATWLRHQRRDDFWKHGSVCEDYAAILCPVYAVSGWADGYSNAVFRLLQHLKVPRKGLIGPWGHKYPHRGVPGPAIGFLQEALRWWDHWLKGDDTGIMDEPMLRVWMRDAVAPQAQYDERPGRWVAEPCWPAPGIEARRYALNPNKIEKDPGDEIPLVICSPQTVGLAAGEWCPYGLDQLGPELPPDQRADDSGSLIFDSEPLDACVEVLGALVVTLKLAADKADAFVAVRLNDVAPDGAVTRVTYGLLNLTHRDGHETLRALDSGAPYQVGVRLNGVAYVFPAGHRIRVSISTTYWPMVWPSPEPVTLTVFAGASSLELPVRPASRDDEALPSFEAAECARPLAVTVLRDGVQRRLIEYDVGSGTTEVAITHDDGVTRIDDIAAELAYSMIRRYRVANDDPLSARAETTVSLGTRRRDWSVRIETRTVLTATRDTFLLKADLDAFEADKRVFCRTWDHAVPRDHG